MIRFIAKARHSRQGRFQHQLTWSLIMGIIALMVSTSLLISWLITSKLKGLITDYAIQVTGQFAENSVFAFLIDNESVSKQVVSQIGSFPGVRHVAILDLDYSVIIAEGDYVDWVVSDHTGVWQERPALAGEDRRVWHFIAPVNTVSDGFSHQEHQSSPAFTQRLGYVYIALDKAPLRVLFTTVVLTTVFICIVFSALLIAWLDQRFRRLTRPLQDLASKMMKAQEGNDSVRADVVGPDEVRGIATVFNRMMASIEKHKDALEAEVGIRTFELEQACDTALTAVRYKSQVMANITHEMRTPLQAIDGYVRVVRKELRFLEDQQPTIEKLNIVLASTNQLHTLINQILDLARIEAGKMEVNLTPVSISEILNQVEETVQPLARKNGNRLDIRFTGQSTIEVDRDKLYQILLNLLTNACKFTHNGAIKVRVSCSAQILRLAVTDNGIGILGGYQDKIFEAFRKIDPPDQRKYPGTGIGLAITQQMCKLLGGEIAVKSETCKGAKFTVTIPLPINVAAGDALMSF